MRSPGGCARRGDLLAPGGWATILLDLVSEQCCVGCGAPASVMCQRCRAWAAGPVISRYIPGIGRVFSAAAHDGPWGRAVAQYKDGPRRALRGPLSGELTRSVAAALVAARWRVGTPVSLVPIPCRPRARRLRGGDTLGELVRCTARDLRRVGVPARRVPLLRHTRVAADQVGLGGSQRWANVAGTLAADGVAVGLVVVVDDVVTTGATLGAAAAALRGAARRESISTRQARIGWATITAAQLRHVPAGLDAAGHRS